jgi:hypothetical protein
MLFLDGVYAEGADGGVRFLWVKVPTSVELILLATPLPSASVDTWSSRDCWNAMPTTAWICRR